MMDLQGDNNGFQFRTEQGFFFHSASIIQFGMSIFYVINILSFIHCENIDFFSTRCLRFLFF